MEKLSKVIENGNIVELRNGEILLAVYNGKSTTDLYDMRFISDKNCYSGSSFDDNGIRDSRSCNYGERGTTDIVNVYKLSYLDSFEKMKAQVLNFIEKKQGYGVTKIWEAPKEIEISFDTFLNAMDGSTLLEWLMTPNEIADAVNHIINNPNEDKNNQWFIDQLKENIPALKDAESFHIEKEPGNCW